LAARRVHDWRFYGKRWVVSVVSPPLEPRRRAAPLRLGGAVGLGGRVGAARAVGLGRRVGAAREMGLGGRCWRWVGGSHGAAILCACGCRGFFSFRHAGLQKMMGQKWVRACGSRRKVEFGVGVWARGLSKSEQRNWGLARDRMGRGWCWVGGGLGHGPPSSAGSRGWLRCRVQGRLISQRVRGRRALCRGAHGGARGGHK
jgi:hypothetical protein